MSFWKWVLVGVGVWELGWWLRGKTDRRVLFAKARRTADAKGKPLLVIGEPMGEYPCGDVTADLAPTSRCPAYVQADVQNLEIFPDGKFGCAFASHVLEHVGDPDKAMAELLRVADEVVIAWPRPWRAATWLVPGHRWIVVEDATVPGGLRFDPHPVLNRRPAHATRYGTAWGRLS